MRFTSVDLSQRRGAAQVGAALAVPLLIVVLTVVAFWPTFHNGLTNWDDDVNLSGNPAYRGLGWANLRWMFGRTHLGHYHPLTWITFAADHYLWNDRPVGFHFTSLLLHAAAAVALYVLSVRLYRLAWGARAAGAGLFVGAGLAAAVFAVHPLRVESVAWATERRDVLSGLFFLLTLLAYLRAHRPTERRRNAWLGVSLACYVLALLSKVMAVSLPVVLMVLDTYPLRRVRVAEWLGRSGLRAWLEKLPYFALALGATLLAILSQTDARAMMSLELYGLGPRLAQAVYGLGSYLSKTLLPTGLAPLYELRTGLSFTDARFVCSAVAVGALTVFLFAVRRRWPAGLAAWSCYVAILVPVCGLFQNGPQVTADRYSYLSCMSWAVLIGGGLSWCWSVDRRRAAALSALGAAGVIGLAVLTHRQTQVWRDSQSLWAQALRVEPHSCLGRFNMGEALEAAGSYADAVEYYRGVVADCPAKPKHHFALGNALDRAGRLDEAIASYRNAIDLKPDYPEAHNNLGNALFRRGETAEAIRAYRRALHYEPRYADAHYNLAVALSAAGETAEAAEHYRRVLELQPTREDARVNLALLLVRQEGFEEAISLLREGLVASPASGRLANLLGLLLATCPDARLRDGAEAVRIAERLCEDSGSADPARLQTLAAAYAEAGRFDAAVAVAERAVALAEAGGRAELAARLRRSLALYEAGRPWRLGVQDR